MQTEYHFAMNNILPRHLLHAICLILLLAFFLSSCKSDSTPDPALQLEQVWHFRGLRNATTGELFPLPAWTDTIPFFEITLTFRRSGYLAPYELEGQGPLRLYYGSFRAHHPDKLIISSLKTTPPASDNPEAYQFDTLYYSALQKVNRFTAEDGILMLHADTLDLVYEATDRPVYPGDYFMKASVNGLPWNASLGNTLASISPDTGQVKFTCTIESHTFDSLSNGTRYEIDLLLNRLPYRGTYPFNNADAVVPVPGAGANCHGWTKDLLFNFFMAWSTEGTLEITEVTRFTLRGTFQFRAVASGTNPYLREVTVTQGSFFLPLLKKQTDWFTPYSP